MRQISVSLAIALVIFFIGFWMGKRSQHIAAGSLTESFQLRAECPQEPMANSALQRIIDDDQRKLNESLR